MTPQHKAKELVDRFRKEFNWVESDYDIDLYRDTRQCALIAIDEIIHNNNEINGAGDGWIYVEGNTDYWQQVKEEIQKI